MNVKKSLLELRYDLEYRFRRYSQRRRFRNLAAPSGGWPILMGVSFPKSGTNLLRQVLAGFMQVAPFSDRSFDVFAAFDAETGAASTIADALRFLAGLNPGDIAAAHFFAWPEVVERLCGPGYVSYFIYRDPRDVVVSHVFYVTKMAPEHAHHQYYAEELQTFDERLSTSILGRPDIDQDFPDIRKRFEPYLGWLECSEVLPLRYEDFILKRHMVLEKVLDHYTRRLDLKFPRERMLGLLEDSILPEKSPTFRSGKVGEWREHFTEQHKQLFKDVAGDLLVRLGYEEGYGW